MKQPTESQQERKKRVERMYLESMLSLSGRQARIEDAECPDFVLHDRGGREGIEVTSLFTDDSEHGSLNRRGEKLRTSFLSKLAEAYYGAGGEPIHVKAQLPRTPSEALQSVLVGRMIEARSNLPLMRSTKLDDLPENLTLWVTVLPREKEVYSHWQSMGDTLGWVGDIDPQVLARKIREKATRLPVYRERVDRVSLLFVADRILNSGKLEWRPPAAPLDACGFTSVYLLIHPLAIHPITQTA